MKRLTLLLSFFAFASLSLFAQRNFNEAMTQGRAALNSGEYTTAIRSFLLAKEFAPNRLDDVLIELNGVYAAINRRIRETDAELNRTRTSLTNSENQLRQARTDLTNTQNQLQQAQRALAAATDTAKLAGLQAERDSLSKALTIADDRIRELEIAESLLDEGCTQLAAFTRLLPRLSQRRNARNVFRALGLTSQERRPNHTEIIISEFLDNSDRRQEIIDIINKKIN